LEHLQIIYKMCISVTKANKESWDALNNNYGDSDADTELYIIEQYHDYKMVDEKGVMVKQAHEI
jgi:hypothetical protein